MEALLFFGGVFVVLVIYFLVGGIGGVAGSLASRQAMRKPSPIRPLGFTAASAQSSMASSAGQQASAGFSRTESLAAINRIFDNDLSPFEVHIGGLIPSYFSKQTLERLAASFVHEVMHTKDSSEPEEPLSSFVSQNEEDFLVRAAVGAIGGAVLVCTPFDRTPGLVG